MKVLFSNNKWPFAKGMTLVMWINPLKKTDCTLWWLKTDEENEIIVRVEDGMLVVNTRTRCTPFFIQSRDKRQEWKYANFPRTL